MKPIIFSPEMVRAILAGNKTQTRRVIKHPLVFREALAGSVCEKHGHEFGFLSVDQNKDAICCSRCGWGVEPISGNMPIKPKYQPGDILWVRETWCRGTARDGGEKTIYKADIEPELACIHTWRPSRYMPRAAARIFLRVTDVRVERVQDISEEDAIAEGFAGLYPPSQRHRETKDKWSSGKCTECAHLDLHTGMHISPCAGNHENAKPKTYYDNVGCTWGFRLREDGVTEPVRWRFMYGWNALNSERGYGWNTNPWVWAYTFERSKASGR